MRKRDLKRFLTTTCFLVLSGIFLISGCSEPTKSLNQEINYPQLIVNPGTVRLGVAKLKATRIVFSGSGFESGDSVFIKLLNVPVNEKKVDLPIASADIEKDGTFNAEVATLTKVTDFLRAKIGSNEKMENIIIITGPPMPVGTYRARAMSMLSDREAECILKVKGPSLIDRIKDWIGVKLGKIVKK
ncbi:MAG: hypothetical protein ACETWD_05700 [Desulfatiglandales bacterium]|nr:MAG: hypothetical protein JSW35_07270 [Deltaproteobacteria bacterium]